MSRELEAAKEQAEAVQEELAESQRSLAELEESLRRRDAEAEELHDMLERVQVLHSVAPASHSCRPLAASRSLSKPLEASRSLSKPLTASQLSPPRPPPPSVQVLHGVAPARRQAEQRSARDGIIDAPSLTATRPASF